MQFVEEALSSLHPSFYTMLFFTIIPMVISIPRVWTFAFLLAYSFSGAWVVYCAIPERPAKKSLVGARMDDRMGLFRHLKLQDS
jgi:hypothetical protein